MFFRHRNRNRKEKCSLPEKLRTSGGRTSLSFLRYKIKAGLTVEAACTIPLFLLCMTSFLMMGISFTEAISAQTYLANQVKEKSVEFSEAWWMQEEVKEHEAEDMIFAETSTSFEKCGILSGFIWEQKFSVRTWIGRDPNHTLGWKGEEKEKEMVYVTLHGEVYHRDLKCSHIHLSIRLVSDIQRETLRNENGEKYYACEYCGGGSGMVYITESGNRYHSSLMCSGLKRSILKVPITQLEGMRPCSRCS